MIREEPSKYYFIEYIAQIKTKTKFKENESFSMIFRQKPQRVVFIFLLVPTWNPNLTHPGPDKKNKNELQFCLWMQAIAIASDKVVKK